MLFRAIEGRAATLEAAGESGKGTTIFGGNRRRRGKFPPRRTISPKEEFLTPPPKEELYAIQPIPSLIGRRSPHAPRLRIPASQTAIESLNEIFGLWSGEEGLSAFGIDEAKSATFRVDGKVPNLSSEPPIVIRGENPVMVEIGEMTGQADEVSFDPDKRDLILTGNVRVDSPETRGYADRFRFQGDDKDSRAADEPGTDLKLTIHPLVPDGYIEKVRSGEIPNGRYEARNLDLIGDNRSLIADYLDYDVTNQRGSLIDARGHGMPLYYGIEKVQIIDSANGVAEDVWITTCDHEVPHYRLRIKRLELRDGTAVIGENTQLQLGRLTTLFNLPRLNLSLLEEREEGVDFRAGHESELDFFVDTKYWFRVDDHFQAALRVMPTTSAGTGFGVNGRYDYMDAPSSPFFRSKGGWESLLTTEDRGYAQFYHRQELSTDTVFLGQWEQWSDPAFFNDFFHDRFINRTGPRTFANVTHTGPNYLLTATASKGPHDFINETEKLPEFTFEHLEHPLASNLFLSNDVGIGSYNRTRESIHSNRLFSRTRLSYDWEPARGLNVVPFVGLHTRFYDDALGSINNASRISTVTGTTVQSRLQRAYKGFGNYSGFKHIFVPSVTYFYEASGGLTRANSPQFDTVDQRQDRSRVESRFDNVLLARNKQDGVVWPIAQFTFFQGNDLSSEAERSADYEIETTFRPRPWWGFNGAFETHNVSRSMDDPGFDRITTTIFYDNEVGENNFNAVLGFNLLDTGLGVLDREILYGAGYRLNEDWSFSFEQRYDFEKRELSRQKYEVRRRMHRWEMGVQIRESNGGVGVRLEFSLIDFPGARLKL